MEEKKNTKSEQDLVLDVRDLKINIEFIFVL